MDIKPAVPNIDGWSHFAALYEDPHSRALLSTADFYNPTVAELVAAAFMFHLPPVLVMRADVIYATLFYIAGF